jgi:cytochrome c
MTSTSSSSRPSFVNHRLNRATESGFVPCYTLRHDKMISGHHRFKGIENHASFKYLLVEDDSSIQSLIAKIHWMDKKRTKTHQPA